MPQAPSQRLGRHLEGTASSHLLPSRLLASWKRSEDYGVSLDTLDPVFTGTADDESLFSRCGREVLTDLQRTLADEPIGLVLTDAHGVVLDRFSGDAALLRELDKVHLAPGFSYAEHEAGTNGLGLALADRVRTVVRADQHYVASLCAYTCAAVPVFDSLTGRLEGAVNLTTWSTESSRLLLALAESAAGNTAALMLARSSGRSPRPVPRGEVLRVESGRPEPGGASVYDLSPGWCAARAEAVTALRDGRIVLVVGEPGVGKATLAAQAHRTVRPRDRILCASVPAPDDVAVWLDLWTPELRKSQTAVVVAEVDTLSSTAAQQLRERIGSAGVGREGALLALTAETFEDVPPALAPLAATVVTVPPLRERPDDVVALAESVARGVRSRQVRFTAAAQQALRDHAWLGNVDQLKAAVRHAAARTDVIDVRHLPSSVLSRGRHRLSRIEAFERDEIVRVLTAPGHTMRSAAEELGLSRATIYRKIAQYEIQLPRNTPRRDDVGDQRQETS